MTSKETEPQHPDAGVDSTPARGPVLQVVLTALAFGCLIGFLRTVSTGFAWAPFVNSAPSESLVQAACSWARFAMLILLTVLGCLRRSIINRVTTVACSVTMTACALVRSVVPALAVQLTMSALVGITSAFVMFALVLLLSSKSLKEIVASSLAGFVVGGVLIGVLGSASTVPGVTLMALCGLLPCFLMLGVDPQMACCEDQGELSRFELARFPWFSSIMLAAMGFLGAVLYGVARTLSWGMSGDVNYAVMGIAALAVIVFTAVIILLQENWVHTVWVPYLILLGCVLAFLVTSGQTVSPATMGLLFALVMSYHFLRWMVFPAIVSTSLLPRVLTNGICLVLTNSIFNVDAGVALAGALPAGMQTPTGMGGTVSLALAVIFAVIMFAERLNRYTDDEVYVAQDALEDLPGGGGEATAGPAEDAASEAGQVEEAPLTLEDRCEQLAQGRELTTRESEVFSWTARGYSSSAIAEKLHISSSTVRFHQQNLYKKLGVHSKQELIQLVAER